MTQSQDMPCLKWRSSNCRSKNGHTCPPHGHVQTTWKSRQGTPITVRRWIQMTCEIRCCCQIPLFKCQNPWGNILVQSEPRACPIIHGIIRKLHIETPEIVSNRRTWSGTACGVWISIALISTPEDPGDEHNGIATKGGKKRTEWIRRKKNKGYQNNTSFVW